MNIDGILNRMMEYYDVHTISDLSLKIGIGQPAISKWKINNSINTVKKRCLELGIYDEIFGKLEVNNISHSTASNGSSIIDNSSQKVQTFNNKQYPDIPEFLLDDINSLFKRVQNKSELIANFDDFIYQQKRILQNATN
jgi:hypothetical protein